MTEQILLPDSERHLARFAQRLTTESQFMANVMNLYREQERIEDEALADLLGLSSATYARLAMCRRPTRDTGNFGNDVKQIADYVGCNALQLAQMINQVDALETIRLTSARALPEDSGSRQAEVGFGWLAAARDRSEEDDDDGKLDLSGDPDVSE